MFGLSFGELVVIVVVAIVAIGPKDMPKVLRKAGQWAGKLRRMASDLRAQSGIDDALRMEGISEDIQEIRKLARGELDLARGELADVQRAAAPNDGIYQAELRKMEDSLLREREYPREGADAYDAVPDAVYMDHPLPLSVWARDPLYALGDPDGVLPPLPEGHDEPVAPPAGPVLAEGTSHNVEVAVVPHEGDAPSHPVSAATATDAPSVHDATTEGAIRAATEVPSEAAVTADEAFEAPVAFSPSGAESQEKTSP